LPAKATDRVIGAAELERDLANYHPSMGTANRDLVMQHHSARDHVIGSWPRSPHSRRGNGQRKPLRELARLTALHWS
jgi:hypothetical protein